MGTNHHSDADKILAEYKNFLRIISHDFNAPLRHLEEFTKLLVKAVGEKIGKEEKQYVFFINQSLTRLSKMQEALLLSSRVHTHISEPQDINTVKLIDEILVELEEFMPADAEILYADLPVICGDRDQLKAVFKILIQNALQYHDVKDKKITVDVTSDIKDKQAIFRIQDGGIGIAPEHYEGIFSMFRRLHAEESYGGGIGAGLTIAKSIIERHNGQIWLDSELHQGSNFYFSLPVAGAQVK